MKPGHPDYKALIFKHANDQDKSIIEKYESPHNYNVIGLAFINGEMWSSSWINEKLGRIYKFKIENNTLKIINSWDTELCCHGIAWDGSVLWCNMGPKGIVEFNITDGLNVIKQYDPSSRLTPTVDGNVHAKGIAWDGKNIWSAYKFTEPVIVKHDMDGNLSVIAGYSYDYESIDTIAEFPGNIAFVNGIMYTASSDPGTGDYRGGRIVRHKMDESLAVDVIFFYNHMVWKYD